MYIEIYMFYGILHPGNQWENVMLEVLSRVEETLHHLLKHRDRWKNLYVNYHPPFVERLWLPFEDGEYRIYLHRIHPCGPGQALFHPHPWPSAMRVLKGEYEMAVGYGAGSIVPPVAAKLILGPGSVYEMTDPDSWHYVRPLKEPTLSLMVTGKPWDRTAPGSGTAAAELPLEFRDRLFSDFDDFYFYR